jgi:hypothetical protein
VPPVAALVPTPVPDTPLPFALASVAVQDCPGSVAQATEVGWGVRVSRMVLLLFAPTVLAGVGESVPLTVALGVAVAGVLVRVGVSVAAVGVGVSVPFVGVGVGVAAVAVGVRVDVAVRAVADWVGLGTAVRDGPKVAVGEVAGEGDGVAVFTGGMGDRLAVPCASAAASAPPARASTTSKQPSSTGHARHCRSIRLRARLVSSVHSVVRGIGHLISSASAAPGGLATAA